jgi:hypothetical protein
MLLREGESTDPLSHYSGTGGYSSFSGDEFGVEQKFSRMSPFECDTVARLRALLNEAVTSAGAAKRNRCMMQMNGEPREPLKHSGSGTEAEAEPVQIGAVCQLDPGDGTDKPPC